MGARWRVARTRADWNQRPPDGHAGRRHWEATEGQSGGAQNDGGEDGGGEASISKNNRGE
eukprot:14966460-Alexandrium_andersonii.AAC.1